MSDLLSNRERQKVAANFQIDDQGFPPADKPLHFI